MAINILLLLMCCATLSQQIDPQPRVYNTNIEPVQSPPKCFLAPGEERLFQSLQQYQSNNISFNPNDPDYQGNEVKFSTEKFDERLEKNSFVSYQSNHIFGITLTQKQLRFVDDGAFSNLDCLYFLDLSHNNLTTVSNGTFIGLSNLRILNVSFNAIKNVTDEFGMEHLYHLDLSHNEVRKLPTFTLLKSLKVLNISYNRIEEVSEDIFHRMVSLEELYLDHNQLHVFELLYWKGLRSLRKLDVAYNLIDRIDLGSEFVTRDLEMLNISGNNLTDLGVDNIKLTLKRLKLLDIRNNKFRCDTLNIIQRDLKCANISVIKPIRCDNATLQSGSGFRSTESLGTNQTKDHSGEVESLKSHIADLEAKMEFMKYINIFLIIVITVLAIFGVVVKFPVCRYADRLFGRRDTDFIDDDVERIDLVRR